MWKREKQLSCLVVTNGLPLLPSIWEDRRPAACLGSLTALTGGMWGRSPQGSDTGAHGTARTPSGTHPPQVRADPAPPGGVRQGREGRKGQCSTAWTQPERACLETYQFENFLKFSLFFWDIKTPKLERHLLTNETAPSGPDRAGVQLQPERPAWKARTLPGRRHSAAGLSHDTADAHAVS